MKQSNLELIWIVLLNSEVGNSDNCLINYKNIEMKFGP